MRVCSWYYGWNQTSAVLKQDVLIMFCNMLETICSCETFFSNHAIKNKYSNSLDLLQFFKWIFQNFIYVFMYVFNYLLSCWCMHTVAQRISLLQTNGLSITFHVAHKITQVLCTQSTLQQIIMWLNYVLHLYKKWQWKVAEQLDVGTFFKLSACGWHLVHYALLSLAKKKKKKH